MATGVRGDTRGIGRTVEYTYHMKTLLIWASAYALGQDVVKTYRYGANGSLRSSISFSYKT